MKKKVNKTELLEAVKEAFKDSINFYWKTYEKPVKSFLVARKHSKKLKELNMSSDSVASLLMKDEKVFIVATEELSTYYMPFKEWHKLEPKERYLLVEKIDRSRSIKEPKKAEIVEDDYFKRMK